MVFHILHTDITPPESMNYPFCYEPDSLSMLAVEGVKSYILSHPEWLPLLQEGKEFAVHGGTAINLFRKNLPR